MFSQFGSNGIWDFRVSQHVTYALMYLLPGDVNFEDMIEIRTSSLESTWTSYSGFYKRNFKTSFQSSLSKLFRPSELKPVIKFTKCSGILLSDVNIPFPRSLRDLLTLNDLGCTNILIKYSAVGKVRVLCPSSLSTSFRQAESGWESILINFSGNYLKRNFKTVFRSSMSTSYRFHVWRFESKWSNESEFCNKQFTAPFFSSTNILFRSKDSSWEKIWVICLAFSRRKFQTFVSLSLSKFFGLRPNKSPSSSPTSNTT